MHATSFMYCAARVVFKSRQTKPISIFIDTARFLRMAAQCIRKTQQKTDPSLVHNVGIADF